VILRHGRTNQRSACNFSIEMVTDLHQEEPRAYTRKPHCGGETALCGYLLEFLSRGVKDDRAMRPIYRVVQKSDTPVLISR